MEDIIKDECAGVVFNQIETLDISKEDTSSLSSKIVA